MTAMAKPQVAGATVLYTVADSSWKIFFYDAASKPIILEPIGAEFENAGKGKKKCFAAPCLFELQEDSFATMVSPAFH